MGTDEKDRSKTGRRVPRYILLGMLAMVVLAAVAYPPVARCVAYHRLVTLCSENLSPQPETVAIHSAEAVTPLDIGYAELALPDEWATAIRIKGTAISILARDGAALVFMPPFLTQTCRTTVTTHGHLPRHIQSDSP